MFRDRWSLTWITVWLIGASFWALLLVSLVVSRWPNLPSGFRGDILQLPLFFLTYFALPVFTIFAGGLALGWLVIYLVKLPIWTVWIDSGELVRALWRRMRS